MTVSRCRELIFLSPVTGIRIRLAGQKCREKADPTAAVGGPDPAWTARPSSARSFFPIEYSWPDSHAPQLFPPPPFLSPTFFRCRLSDGRIFGAANSRDVACGSTSFLEHGKNV